MVFSETTGLSFVAQLEHPSRFQMRIKAESGLWSKVRVCAPNEAPSYPTTLKETSAI